MKFVEKNGKILAVRRDLVEIWSCSKDGYGRTFKNFNDRFPACSSKYEIYTPKIGNWECRINKWIMSNFICFYFLWIGIIIIVSNTLSSAVAYIIKVSEEIDNDKRYTEWKEVVASETLDLTKTQIMHKTNKTIHSLEHIGSNHNKHEYKTKKTIHSLEHGCSVSNRFCPQTSHQISATRSCQS